MLTDMQNSIDKEMQKNPEMDFETKEMYLKQMEFSYSETYYNNTKDILEYFDKLKSCQANESEELINTLYFLCDYFEDICFESGFRAGYAVYRSRYAQDNDPCPDWGDEPESDFSHEDYIPVSE